MSSLFRIRTFAGAALVWTAIGAQAQAQSIDDEDVLFSRALALSDVVVDHGCSPRLLGSAAHPFHEAPAACDVFLSLALASMAVDHEERREPARAAIAHLLDHALSPRVRAPFRSTGTVRVGDRDLPRSVLYRGYLLLVTVALERVGGTAAIADPLARALAHDLDGAAAGWLPSFGHTIWPCDHAPAAAGLLLQRDPRWRASGDALARRLSSSLDSRFPTRVDAQGRAVEPLPRGTVLAFTAGFLQHADRALAARFASVLTSDFCDTFGGLAACREWPRGVDRGPDAVSGPIQRGYGIGASALAMGATRALDDESMHRHLVTAAHTMGIERYLDRPSRFGLENAIYLWARAARPL